MKPWRGGLGFTQEKNGVEYVKWERVSAYLAADFIPENIFCRLAMKAKNETVLCCKNGTNFPSWCGMMRERREKIFQNREGEYDGAGGKA